MNDTGPPPTGGDEPPEPAPVGGRLHVAMVIQRFRPLFTGQGVQLESLARELAKRGVRVTILTPQRSAAPAVEDLDGYTVRRLFSHWPGRTPPPARSWVMAPLFGLKAAHHLLRHRRAIDLVHVHSLTDALYTSLALRALTKTPVLFEMTLLDADDPPAMQRSPSTGSGLRYAMFTRCDGYVAISPALADRYRLAGLPEDRLRMIPQGVDTATFAPATNREAVRRELELPVDGPLCVFVGSLIERKGVDLVLRAWSAVHLSHPEAHLVLVGKEQFPEDDAAAGWLAREWSQLPVAARRHVHRVGVRSDVGRYLQASDLSVFPSRREGFGTVIIEAMACGLPCIVGELPGITDYIFEGDGSDGVVIPQDDQEALMRAMRALLSDHDRRREIGRCARRRAVHAFDLGHVADQYVTYYRALTVHQRTQSPKPF